MNAKDLERLLVEDVVEPDYMERLILEKAFMSLRLVRNVQEQAYRDVIIVLEPETLLAIKFAVNVMEQVLFLVKNNLLYLK